MTSFLAPLGWLGRQTLETVRQAGGLALVAGRTLRALPRLDRKALSRAMVHFGYDSIPLGVAIAVFTGGILVLLANINVQRYGARSLLGWAAGYTIVREFGPLFTALVLTGRVGARNAAELASMNIGGQLEGLRGVGVDPFALLVAPRTVASALSISALGFVCIFVAVLAAAVFGQLIIDVHVGTFVRSFASMCSFRDVAAGIVKLFVFGTLIALVSTRCGLLAKGGARAVGRVAATSVVANAALLSALDWGLALALARVL